MRKKFEIHFVSVGRLFKLATESNYDDLPLATYAYLFKQCDNWQKQRLKDLYPEFVSKLQDEMRTSDGYRQYAEIGKEDEDEEI